MTASTAAAPRRGSVLGALLSTLIGVAAAFGLSASGIVLGALLARLLDTFDVLPDRLGPAAWMLFAAVGVAGAGATVVEVAGSRALHSILIAGGLVFAGLWQIMNGVESTGAEGAELPVVAAFAAIFVGLLGTGARLRRWRLTRALEP
ncbi:MAG: hypothetical protein ACT452_02915 [Microthrixaceae bacterium]